ncbi:MAG: hypothetical protein EPO68_13185 [Planctomycetota bacterium]|nr:MAG: hypothetical protein EPO68_13185 [Planctomycetota bacterium]
MQSKQLAIVAAVAALSGGLGVVVATRVFSHADDVEQPAGAPKARKSAAPESRAPTDVVERLERAALSVNEAAALATLRALTSAQAMASVAAIIDVDRDDSGEYAFLGELAGTRVLRGSTALLDLTLMPPEFGEVTAGGIATRSGYHFRVFLPGAPINARTPGLFEGSRTAPDADAAEVLWCAYAWPVRAGSTGARAFFVNQEGDLLTTSNEDKGYSGEDHGPAFDAALGDERPGDMASTLPTEPEGHTGNDGRVWKWVGL